MQSASRLLAIFAVQCLLSMYAFAGDPPKPAATPQETGTSDSAAPAAATAATDTPQTPAPAPQPKAQKTKDASHGGENTPRGELFLGYSYLQLRTNTGPVPTVSEHFDFIPGGVGALRGNITKHFGFTGEVGGYILRDVGKIDSQVYTFMFGPHFRFPKGRWTPFVHTLVGGARLTTSVSSSAPPGFLSDARFFNPSPRHENQLAVDGGVGLDFNAGRHVAIRFFQADYLYTQFHDLHNNRQDNIRASGGLVFRFGFPQAAAPPVHHPPTATCSANPPTIHAETGEVAAIHADAKSPDNLPLTFTWSATGGTVDGTGPDVRWNPGASAPGTYTVTAKVDDGQGGTTSCSTDVRLEPRPNRPPTMTCSASSSSVPAGQRVQITAVATDPDNDPLTYTWKASGGQIVGQGPKVQWDTTGLAPGHYTINGHVDDGRGGTADCTVEIDVQIPVEQKELETKLALHSIFFPTAQPTAKNPNGGLLASQQRTLLSAASDFKKYMAYKPDAHLILHGYADPRGSKAYNQALSERRVARVKNFLVEQGVPADHIETQGLGEEQPLSAAQIKALADQDTTLTPDQRARIAKNARAVALAQSRRVDLTLSTTGQTSERKYPFNAEDVLNLINPRGAAAPAKPPTGKPPARRKRTTPAPTKK
jgi:outer membrane protein OmpA-like peptidoglycan-associated protein